jgi:osmotically-inducible protein OsmY
MKSDALITHEVLCELKWDTHVDDTEVLVEVDRGTVTLTGTVGHYGKKVAAQEAAHRVAGVRDVVNDLTVHIPTHLARTDTANRIQVHTRDGTVTLTGHVGAWKEKLAIIDAVSHAPGVETVEDHLSIAPYV